QNRVLVTKPHNKTPYELLHGRTPSIGFTRPFGYPVTILNTLDPLGKFQEKVDEGFLVGYSVCSKAFRVFNSRTHDYSRFTWVFFLATKDETSPILKTFITSLENQLSLKVKVIRSNNGTEFKNNDLNQFCRMQGIKREFSVPRTPQQNDIAERKNMTLIEAARTMLVDSLLPIPFWTEAVNTACYVKNRNTDGDAAFDEKEPEFDEKKPESEVSVSPISSAQSKKQDDKTKREAKGKSHVESFTGYRNLSAEFKDFFDNSINEDNAAGTLVPTIEQISPNSANTFSAAGPLNAAASPIHGKSSFIDASQLFDYPKMLELEDITYSDDEDDVGAEADFNNLETS
nr:putative ribonuclease H-like domain-containing protein [Tanacetum cinerariifolium]